MAEETVFYRIQIEGADTVEASLSKLTLESKALADQKKALNKQLDDLNKAYRENTITQKEYDAQSKVLAQDIAQTNLQIKQNSADLSANQKTLLDSAKATQTAEGSIEQMRLELAKAQKEYVKLSKAERDNKDIGGVLQKQIKEQSDELKDLEKNVGITSRSVGDYGQAVQGVLPLMGGFGAQINAVIGQLTGIKTALSAMTATQKASAVATNLSSKALKLFRIALISTGIGAIVVALGSLVAYFTSTQAGADKVTKVLRPLQAVFSSLFGVLQDVGGAAFEVLTGYWSIFINAFKLGYKVFEGGVLRMRIAWNEFTGDDLEAKELQASLDEVNKEIDEARGNIEQGAKDMAKGFSKMADIASGAGDRISEAFSNGQREAELEIEIEKLEAIERLTLGRLQRERLAQKEIAEDNNKTLAERTIAAQNEIALLGKITDFEKGILDKKIEKLKLEQTYNDTSREGNKELNDLIAQQEEIEARASEQRIEISKRLYATKKAESDAYAKKIEEDAKAKLKAEQDLINKEIELTEIARELEANINEESAEDRYQKEVELQKKIFDLKIESAKKAGEDTVLLEQQKLLAIAKLDREERDRLKEEEAKRKEEEKVQAEKDQAEKDKADEEKEAERKALNAQILSSAQELSGTLLETLKNRTEREKQLQLSALNARLEQGLISQEEFEKQREKIERRAFEQKKKQDTAQALINGAVAITKALATSGLAGLLLAGTIGVQTAAQVATIQKQKFSKGGIARGKSHANGGIPFTVAGQGGYEMEGGEAIINKRSTEMFRDQLSAINQMGGGVAFAKGGLATPNYSAVSRYRDGGIASISGEIGKFTNIKADIIEGVVSSIQSIKVVNVATETTNRSSRVKDIENQNSF